MLRVNGQIAGTFPESTDATAGKIERASPPALLLSDELQTAADNLGFGLPGGLPQLVEGGPVRFGETSMNVIFHAAIVAQMTEYVLHHQ